MNNADLKKSHNTDLIFQAIEKMREAFKISEEDIKRIKEGIEFDHQSYIKLAEYGWYLPRLAKCSTKCPTRI